MDDEHEEKRYFDRVRRVFDMLDVRTAFTTPNELNEALSVLEKGPEEVSKDKYRTALKVRNAIIHPDTGQPVLLPLRVSMIVPMNLVLDTGMLVAKSTSSTIFSQWLNQTYNALHYYANRNATNHDSDTQRFAAYCGATYSSVAASLMVRHAAQVYNNPMLGRFAPFAAVAAADLLNISMMRQSEYRSGVNVYDQDGNCLGKSRRAGVFAVASCLASRILAAAPNHLVPPILMEKCKQQQWLIRNPRLRLPLLLIMVGGAIQFSVPITFGLFRQEARVHVKYLELQFQQRRNRNEEHISHVTYNKGV